MPLAEIPHILTTSVSSKGTFIINSTFIRILLVYLLIHSFFHLFISLFIWCVINSLFGMRLVMVHLSIFATQRTHARETIIKEKYEKIEGCKFLCFRIVLLTWLIFLFEFWENFPGLFLNILIVIPTKLTIFTVLRSFLLLWIVSRQKLIVS